MKLFLIFIILYSLFLIPSIVRAETPAEIQQLVETRQRQISELEGQIAQFWNQVEEKKSQGASVQNAVEILKVKIAASELEIRSLQLAIEESGYKLKQTESKIGEVSQKLDLTRGRLSAALRLLYEREEAPLLLRFVEAERLSEMFVALGELEQLHQGLQDALAQLKNNKSELEEVRDEIAQEKSAQERLKRIEESQRQLAAQRKARQIKTLAQIEKEKGKLLGTIQTKKRDLDKIREQIEYLARAGVSAEQAVRFGELAAIRTGVRTSFLIAVLEVESRLGLNVGKGNWRDDMHKRDHEAFKAITAKLGRDPDTTPVSKAPSYGWGGAMGPAQFLPNTWLAYEAEVARLTGRSPADPWNIEDAFTAAALKLARGGAASKTREGETRAARAYIGGSPNCAKRICNYYANLVVEKAEEIEAELSKNGKT